MKVIILAGGMGTRLPNSAKNIPKALVQIHGKTILDHQLEILEKHGLKDVRLSLGFRADQIVAHLKKTGRDRVEHIVEEEPLGTGGAVRFAARDLADDFMVLNGDILTDFDFSKILRAHEPGSAMIVAAWREDARDFGLLDIKESKIRAFLEKPAEPRSGYINAGCYILNPKHFAGLSEKAFMIEKDIFPRLAESGELHAFLHDGFWQDVGTEDRLQQVKAVPRISRF